MMELRAENVEWAASKENKEVEPKGSLKLDLWIVGELRVRELVKIVEVRSYARMRGVLEAFSRVVVIS